MTSHLFRQQAVRAKTQTPFGPVLVVRPFGSGLLSIGAFVLAALIVTFLVIGEYRARETVQGVITTTEANVRVHARTAGVVAEILIAEGETVSRQQPLIRLDTARAVNNGESTESEILAALNYEAASIEEQINQNKLLNADRRRALEQRIKTAHAQLQSIENQHNIVLEQMTLARANSERFALAKNLGHGPVVAQEAAQANYLNVELQLSRLVHDRLTEHSALRRAQLELRQLPLIERSRRAEWEVTLQQLRQRVADTQARQSATIVAPISGRVSGLSIRIGQTLTPGQPALTLLPEVDRYYAELYLPTSAIGFVEPNAEVQIRYDAFPHQKFGVHRGRVMEIARTLSNPNEGLQGNAPRVPSYRLRVALSSQSITAYGKSRPLRAGMTLQADLLREKRRIIEWIFDPLLSATTKI
ncbi:MAG: HlyD family efflux transporter periplasmic adaptor subunit [Gammaproteobacteria bacterium]|nr:HlyD family efflux transporter periplasmic adaptor subunit [Gammaproteobacteria bacterium]